jgi:hypothetical protein
MLLSHCPNCQHDNKPGERFCAACGVPLDLKPCPVCGKVDNVAAKVCAGCGAVFPALMAARPVDDTLPAEFSSGGMFPPPVVSPPVNNIRPLPLIIVAIAAGGIPLLWLYRHEMPLPKAWQPQNSMLGTPTTVPTPVVVVPQAVAPAPAVVPASIPEPVPTSASVPTDAALVKDANPAESDQEMVGTTQTSPRKKAARAAHSLPAARSRSLPEPASAVAPVPANKDAAPAARECTEALAAVGLCEPKAEQK